MSCERETPAAAPEENPMTAALFLNRLNALNDTAGNATTVLDMLIDFGPLFGKPGWTEVIDWCARERAQHAADEPVASLALTHLAA
jgi:hypothetical protein